LGKNQWISRRSAELLTDIRASQEELGERIGKRGLATPSKLDPYLSTIENWLAVEPQLTALAIVRRLTVIDPSLSDKQHSTPASVLPADGGGDGYRIHAAGENTARGYGRR
jgi:hypothetical protein